MRFIFNKIFLSCFCAALVISGAAQNISFERYYDFGYTEQGYSICKTPDSGYVVAGQQRQSIGYTKHILMKVDSVGVTQWVKFFGSNYDNALYGVKPTFDGGFIATGYTTNSIYTNFTYVVKTNSFGDTVWTSQNISPIIPQPFGGPGNGYAQDVVQLSDSNFIVLSNITDFDTLRIILLSKLDQNGDTIWTKKIRHPNGLVGQNIVLTNDGGFVISSRNNYSIIPVFTAGALIIKTDSNGDTLWTKDYPVYTNNCGAVSVVQTQDNGFFIAGVMLYPSDQTTDYFIVKTDQQGDTIWTKIIGGSASDGGSGIQTTNGGYFLGGNTFSYGAGSSDVYILKLDTTGSVQWQRTYGGVNFDYATSILQTNDGGYIACGFETSFGNGNGNIYLIKTDSTGYAPTGLLPMAEKKDYFVLYPNPSNGQFSIKYSLQEKENGLLQIFNSTGALVSTHQLPKDNNLITIDEDLPSGIYFCMIIVEGAIVGSQKLIIVR